MTKFPPPQTRDTQKTWRVRSITRNFVPINNIILESHSHCASSPSMPARVLSMELPDQATPQPSSSPNDATDRRKSGRVKHKPVLLQSDPNAMIGSVSGKRKRASIVDQPDADDSESEESSPDESDGDPDEEELKEKRRKGRPRKTSAKPVAKKSKTTQPKTTTLPVRPATNGVKKPSKPRQPRARPNAAFAENSTGLFGELRSYPRNLCTDVYFQPRSSPKVTPSTQLQPNGSRDMTNTMQMPCANSSTLSSNAPAATRKSIYMTSKTLTMLPANWTISKTSMKPKTSPTILYYPKEKDTRISVQS